MVKLDFRGQEGLDLLVKLDNEFKTNENKIVCIVDSLTNKENIEKKLDEGKHIYKTTSSENEFYIEIIINKKNSTDRDYVVVIDKNYMGEGDKELGKALIKSFISTLCGINELPSHILLYNEGVKLVSEDSEVLEKLNILNEKGVEILCCGSCVKYFDLTDKIKVGSISTMFEILSSQITAKKVIKP